MPTVRYFAAARAAAGTREEQVTAATLDELVDELGRRHGEDLVRVLKSCSFLVDGLTRHDRGCDLSGSSTVDVLPPFAGG